MSTHTTPSASPSRLRTLLVLVAALLPVLGLLVAAPAASALEQDPQITFCHASSSVKNPYQTNTTDADSIFKQGHDGHLGPAWNASMVQGDTWGDIIPAFDYIDSAGNPAHYPGLNTELADVIANDCSPVHATATAPTKTDETCTASGTITIPSVKGVVWTLDSVSKAPGTYDVAVGPHTVTAAPIPGYIIDGQTSWTLTVAAHGSCTTIVTAAVPTVVESSTCGVEGTYTIPDTTGVTYLLDGTAISAGSHSGPAKGTITAQALPGYELSNPTWSFALDVPAAEACPVVTVVTPVDPTVVQSPTCGVEGSYTIPETTGITYLLDGDVVAAGTHAGPAKGTVTAVAKDGYELSTPTWSFALDVPAAEACPVIVVALPEDPTVTQSTACGVEGSYTIPSTTGVDYLLDGTAIDAGTYAGPASGTVTAVAQAGYTLADPAWSYDLSVAAAEDCPLPSTGGTLPKTGSDSAPLAGVAALLLAIGTSVVVLTTRRPTTR